MTLRREVKFFPAYDRRDQNAGQGSVMVRFLVQEEETKKAVHLLILTGWVLPTMTWMPGRPYALETGYHSPTPMWEGQFNMGNCPVTGGDCYYEGRGANDYLEALISGGSDKVWEMLEGYWYRVYGGAGGALAAGGANDD